MHNSFMSKPYLLPISLCFVITNEQSTEQTPIWFFCWHCKQLSKFFLLLRHEIKGLSWVKNSSVQTITSCQKWSTHLSVSGRAMIDFSGSTVRYCSVKIGNEQAQWLMLTLFFCVDFFKCLLLQGWNLKCRIFDICALVSLLLKSTKVYFNRVSQ